MSHAPLVVELLLALNLGLVSQLHCIGMCGGIVGALALAVAPDAAARHGLLRFALAYNLGRIASYAAAGLLLGQLGSTVGAHLPGSSGHTVLRLAAALALAVTGWRLLGLPLPGGAFARLPARAWLLLRRPVQGLVPLRSLRAALLFGAVWGFLPCAMVYATLALAAGSAAPLRGAAVMLAFGLGTSPALIAALTFAGRMPGLFGRPWLRLLAGGLLLAGAVIYAVLAWPGSTPDGDPHSSHHHARHGG